MPNSVDDVAERDDAHHVAVGAANDGEAAPLLLEQLGNGRHRIIGTDGQNLGTLGLQHLFDDHASVSLLPALAASGRGRQRTGVFRTFRR